MSHLLKSSYFQKTGRVLFMSIRRYYEIYHNIDIKQIYAITCFSDHLC